MEERQLRERAEIERRLSALTYRWEREAQDGDWSNGAEVDIRAAVSLAREGADVVSLDCRTTVCQLVVEHPDRSAQDMFLGQVQWEPGFRGEGMMQRENEDGVVRTRFFLGREGHEILPE